MKPDPELTRLAAELLGAAPGCERLARKVQVLWHGRLSSSAGQARVNSAMVLLNPRLREHADEVDRTLRHELAHLAAYARAGRGIEPHGREWRLACKELGIGGERRCHDLPLPRRKVERRHIYCCPNCGYVLRRTRAIPPRRALACSACCRALAGGSYDPRFRFEAI